MKKLALIIASFAVLTIAHAETRDALSFTSEIGNGYYGSKTPSIHPILGTLVTSNPLTLNGYDVLAGAIYKMHYFDIFGEAGFMMDKLRDDASKHVNPLSQNKLLGSTATQKGDNMQALPEIKVGGVYNLYPNWGFTIAYMHVFSASSKFKETLNNAITTPNSTNGYANIQNSSLNSVTFGLRYSIM